MSLRCGHLAMPRARQLRTKGEKGASGREGRRGGGRRRSGRAQKLTPDFGAGKRSRTADVSLLREGMGCPTHLDLKRVVPMLKCLAASASVRRATAASDSFVISTSCGGDGGFGRQSWRERVRARRTVVAFSFSEKSCTFQRTTMENARAGRRERTDASGPTFLRQSLASSTAGPHSRPSIFAALTAATVAADPDPNVDVDCDGCSTRGIQEDVSMARCRSDGRSTSERHAIGECRVRRCERARGRLSAPNEAMPRAGVREWNEAMPRGETCRRFFSFCPPFCHPFATWQPVFKTCTVIMMIRNGREIVTPRARARPFGKCHVLKTQVQKIPTGFHLTDDFPRSFRSG